MAQISRVSPAGPIAKVATRPSPKKAKPKVLKLSHTRNRLPAHLRQEIESLKEEGALSSLADRSRATFENLEKGHRETLYADIAERFRVASLIRLDDELRRHLAKLVKSAGLPCKVTGPDSVWRAYMRLTIPDAKLASKYQRRVAEQWKARLGHIEVEQFLREQRIEKKPKDQRTPEERRRMAHTAVMKGANHKVALEFSPGTWFRLLHAKEGEHFCAHLEVIEQNGRAWKFEVQLLQNVA